MSGFLSCFEKMSDFLTVTFLVVPWRYKRQLMLSRCNVCLSVRLSVCVCVSVCVSVCLPIHLWQDPHPPQKCEFWPAQTILSLFCFQRKKISISFWHFWIFHTILSTQTFCTRFFSPLQTADKKNISLPSILVFRKISGTLLLQSFRTDFRQSCFGDDTKGRIILGTFQHFCFLTKGKQKLP